jgi:hypothetical protein
VVIALLGAGGLAVVANWSVRHRAGSSLPPTNSAIRGDLESAIELAGQMTMPNARDEAYAKIVRRALEPHDYEFACRAAEQMTIVNTKDQTLGTIVDDAIKTGQRAWARHAAEFMVTPTNRDAALKRILDAPIASGGSASGSAERASE